MRDRRVEERFAALASEWRDAVEALSSTAMFMHPAYQQIIGLGPAALPAILQDLRETGANWFWALRAITGENPVPREASGDLRSMAEAWLSWGRARRLV